jgi:hypothetical protein
METHPERIAWDGKFVTGEQACFRPFHAFRTGSAQAGNTRVFRTAQAAPKPHRRDPTLRK